MSLFAASQKDI